MFEKAKQLYEMQKQAKAIKKELEQIHIEASVDVGDAKITVTVNGEMQVVSVGIPEGHGLSMEALGEKIAEATNKAVKKAQEVAAEKMRGIMGSMGGLMGGQ